MLHFNTNHAHNSNNFNHSSNLQNANQTIDPESGPSTSLSPASNQINTLNVETSQTNVLLSTIQLGILDSRGNFQKLRALLDGGSQANFIT